MKKKEALEYITKKMGYVPYIGLFEIYSDEDEIPHELIYMSCIPIKTNSEIIFCSSEFSVELNKILVQYNTPKDLEL